MQFLNSRGNFLNWVEHATDAPVGPHKSEWRDGARANTFCGSFAADLNVYSGKF
jgi:hypothetical protein